ncbi:MAG: VOC family protein, partial [Rhodothermia bacterium]
FIDPQGAYFSIIKYAFADMGGTPEFDFADAFKTHGAFSWFELRCEDVGAAREFYTALFGWNIEDMPMGDNSYPVIKVGDVGVGGMTPLPAPGIPPHWGGYITVDDSDAIAEAATAAGATIHASMTIPTVGRFHAIADPQGAVVSVITYEKPAE